MDDVPFTLRHETRRPERGLIYDDVPERVRVGFANVVGKLETNLDELAQRIYEEMDRPISWDTGHWHLVALANTVEWDEFCDLCEHTFAKLPLEEDSKFADGINRVFLRNYFGYELRGATMERVGTKAQETAIAQARGILREADLAGPDEQFQKAIGFYNRRPVPDFENCVKEAISAVEGLTRILLQDNKLTLSDALKRLRVEKDVHPTLVAMLDKLYAYRGDAEGVGHALTTEKEVRLEEAELALGSSASAIVYVARLFGREVS